MEQGSRENTDIGFYIKKLDNHIERYMHSLYSRKDFQECSLMNMRVADYLFHQQGAEVYQKDVEAEFFINRATASKMLKLMEEKQLIKRTVSGMDARWKRIELEPKGIKLHEAYQSIRQDMEQKLAEHLTEEEAEQFKALCRCILQNM